VQGRQNLGLAAIGEDVNVAGAGERAAVDRAIAHQLEASPAEDHRIIHGFDIHAIQVAERPGDVVVRRIGRIGGKVLLRQQSDSEIAIGLIELDDVITSGIALRALVYLDGLPAQLIDEIRGALRVSLCLRNYECVWRPRLAAFDAVRALAVEVVEEQRPVVRGVAERGEDPGLHVVGVVARRPADFLRGWFGPIPCALGHGIAGVARARQVAHVRVRAGISERLVEAADAVVIVGDPDAIAGPPAIIERPREGARQALGGHTGEIVIREHLPLPDDDRIDLLVVRTRPGHDVEKWHGFV
jgi:hypothetical protein